jgi:hypothetical protein
MERRGGKYGRPRTIVTEGLRAYSAAMREVGNADRQEVARSAQSRAENSHQPFRRRERAMQRFRSMKTLQKFSSVHAQVHNYFNQERHIVTRQVCKQIRSAALAEWRAACRRSPIAGGHVALCVDDRRYFDKALFSAGRSLSKPVIPASATPSQMPGCALPPVVGAAPAPPASLATEDIVKTIERLAELR